MSFFWQQNKTIILFFILLSGVTALSFIDDKPEEKTKSLTQILAEPVESKRSPAERFNDRSPAATESSASGVAVDRKPQQKIKLSIFCNPESLKSAFKTHLASLELSSCVELKEKHQLWVRNETNGFRAHVFNVERGKFKTDFIQLKQGNNKIVLEGILKDGQRVVQTLDIISGS